MNPSSSGNPPESTGKPPKSAERIRQTLEAVQRAQTPVPAAGPLSAGVTPDHPVVVVSFYDHESCRRFQLRLLEAGVMSSVKVSRVETRLSVDASDRARAAAMLAEYEVEFPNRRPAGRPHAFDFGILGAAIGGTIGMALAFSEFRGVRDVIAVLTLTLLGGMFGSLSGRLGAGLAQGRFLFGLADVLILAAIPALVFFLWQLMTGR